ncbi:hypothetical protein BDW22DRAFT_1348937 [Trametopsis cervina]|nr:hypothetical protein BDW22DRAFT_1348937 [Trametopsis cervina]
MIPNVQVFQVWFRHSMLVALLVNYGLAHCIFSYCGPVAIFKVRRTSRILADVVEQYLRSAFNIERSLTAFFEDVRGFRRLQRRAGLLISGSFALQFFGREQGYEFRPTRTQAQDAHTVLRADEHGAVNGDYGYPTNGIFAVLSFEKTVKAGQQRNVVQLIVAWRAPMEIILGFHSTCVLNVITADTAYAMYPWSTFEDMNNLVLIDTPSQITPLAKYARRGWALTRELHFPQFELDLPSRSMQDYQHCETRQSMADRLVKIECALCTNSMSCLDQACTTSLNLRLVDEL